MPLVRLLRIGATALAIAGACAVHAAAPEPAPAPAMLSESGLYADIAARTVAPRVREFAPRFPLWSDGSAKRRWILLPEGAFIDASDADRWEFPPGTRFWKEFAVAGRPVETRLIERLASGQWRFVAYVWDEAGRDAKLAPESGFKSLPVAGAPGGKYRIPSKQDCLACHESAAAPVLGFSAVQLSRAPAPGLPDLRALVREGWLRGLPAGVEARDIDARTPVEHAALGYLHGNCANCHNGSEQRVPVQLDLQQRFHPGRKQMALRTLLGESRFREAGRDNAAVIVPGHAADSVLIDRMRSTNPMTRMPPIATVVPDESALAVLRDWIDHDLVQQKEKTR
ncbi:MAG TPA: c-type cytochrome domain-containing protein [Ramlibacter sp.]|nr:c-type cytochrome domain-containing protein [Ramlibacter sp.]